jgi:hypothetical protein
MIRFILLFLAFFGLLSALPAQSLMPDVIASGGTSYSNSAGQLDWTLGEPATLSFSGSSNMLSQGFHQPDLSVTTGLAAIASEGITVYPNPTVNALQIQFKDPATEAGAELFDTQGKLVYSSSLTGAMQINMSEYPSGTYLLKISENNKTVRTCQIIKN